MSDRRYQDYLAVPAIVPAKAAIGILTACRWLLVFTCIAVVVFVLGQVAMVLNDVSHHRTPAVLRNRHRIKITSIFPPAPERT
ncbi:MAG: hypothetical protein ACRYFU_03235 [Janthinobacterium lividum]